MSPGPNQESPVGRPLRDAARCAADKIMNPGTLRAFAGLSSSSMALVTLAAGKGTRFGRDPKCIQAVHGTPLARHSIEAFRRGCPGAPAICIVGYRGDEVAAALGPDNTYVRSDNPAGGTAFAVYEAFSVAALAQANPLLVITMGDRVVPTSTFRRLIETHRGSGREADLTFLTARYEPPRNRGKGRVLRDAAGRVTRLIEEKDIAAEPDAARRQALLEITEGNCPLYVIRAVALLRLIQDLGNANMQGQYYLTDIIAAISRDGGDIRTVTTTVNEPEYDLLCSDVTQPRDLALLEGILAATGELAGCDDPKIAAAARLIASDRPRAQVAAIARQLRGLAGMIQAEQLPFTQDQPVAIGLSGGRLRLAFMHPDMGRFFGPAWQMPIGAGDPDGDEQIVILAQEGDDHRIHLYPSDLKYRENVNCIPSDSQVMYPGEDVSDLLTYEAFGTRMSESLLLSLGYFSDEELNRRRAEGLPLPPPSLWVSSSMRRPFALVGNAIASLRTLRSGNLGARVQRHLGRERFAGLRVVSTGSIPQGGFSSSSAVTVATKNAINALFDLGIPADLLVHLACQAEYGTGVRAGALDQATEQKGRAGQGTLISSNPRDNYRVLGTYPVPTHRIRIVFPYSVERDRAAWRWSWGAYGETAGAGPLTAGEMRKLTGKAAELAAVLTRLPLTTDFFKEIEEDLTDDGALCRESRERVRAVLKALPLLISRDDLRERVMAGRDWLAAQLRDTLRLDEAAAAARADAALAALFTGWRDPVLRRTTASGASVIETGVPLRAIVAYLFGEVATCFRMIRHPDEWIACVTRSQHGDRSVDLAPERLPDRSTLASIQDWEQGAGGPALLDRWLHRYGATPVDFNRGLDDASLAADEPPEFDRLEGANFFRGLALIDLAEAMLKRAFGESAVAVRVNAAGQGDYFQVHVDTSLADVHAVKDFLRAAFYRRFGLAPVPEFVELHSGGGAAGVQLDRFSALPDLIRRLERMSATQTVCPQASFVV